jgi:hypothetical protein
LQKGNRVLDVAARKQCAPRCANRAATRKATATGLGAWWNAGASHMHAAVNNGVLATWGLRSLLDQHRAMQRSM